MGGLTSYPSGSHEGQWQRARTFSPDPTNVAEVVHDLNERRKTFPNPAKAGQLFLFAPRQQRAAFDDERNA